MLSRSSQQRALPGRPGSSIQRRAVGVAGPGADGLGTGRWSARFVLVALLMAGLGALAMPSTTSAQVKVMKQADGTTKIYNESVQQRSRRLSSTLQPLTLGSQLARWIEHYARREGLSPRLLQAVVQVESGYNPRALSSKGAMGLMQLMPATAQELGVADAYDPEDNIRGGARYLRQQIDRFAGDVRLALAAYNAGPTAVVKYGDIPPYRETRNYVDKVLALYRYSVPSYLKDVARDEAKKRHLEAARRHVEEQQQRGREVYLTRGENNRIKITTAPPKLD